MYAIVAVSLQHGIGLPRLILATLLTKGKNLRLFVLYYMIGFGAIEVEGS